MDLWFSEHLTDHTRFSIRVKEQLFHGKSDFQTIDIYDTFDFGKVMTIDGKFMITERDEFIYHDMIAHVPLLSHKDPKDVLVIGGGDGGTVREVLKHKGIESVDLCEIDQLVIETSRRFFPNLSCGLDDPKTRVLIRDGIEYTTEQKSRYDIVLVDSTDPIGPAEGLFNREFYQSVFNALREDGIMVVQSEGPLWIPETVKEIVTTIRSLFPVCELYTFPVPSYPFGYWSFTFASKKHGPFEHFSERRAREIAKSTRYYNEGIHRSAFALPNFLKQELKSSES
jgi:spermidine synthase